jgi:hypothetical protein
MLEHEKKQTIDEFIKVYPVYGIHVNSGKNVDTNEVDALAKMGATGIEPVTSSMR